MLFYKFVLRAGHVGGGNEQELVVFVYGNSYMSAIKRAKFFPAVKHHKSNTIISSKLVDEEEFIKGILVNGYSNLNNSNIDLITKLESIKNKLSYIKGYNFTTDIAKKLKEFCDEYSKADNKQKAEIEKEYIKWAENIINENNLNF